MSWQNSFTGSNNIHLGHPPLMSDGRNFITTHPDNQLNQDILVENRIMSNSDYRTYLTNNSEKIIANNQLEACSNSKCFRDFKRPQMEGTNQPYFFASAFDNTTPFGYVSTDMKNVYLTREQLQSRKVAPTLKIEK